MALSRTLSRKERRTKKKYRVFWTVSLLVLILTFIALLYYKDSFQQQYPNLTVEPRIYFMGNLCSAIPLYINAEFYFPLAFVQENIDPNIQWDNKSGLVVVTNPQGVYYFTPDSNEGKYNLKACTFDFLLISQDNTIYFPVSMIKKFYNVEIKEDLEQQLISVRDLDRPVQLGRICRSGKLRIQPALRSNWLKDLVIGQSVAIFGEENNSYRVQTADGHWGYIHKRKVELADIERKESLSTGTFQPFNPCGEPILLTWEFVAAAGKTVDTGKIGDLGGVHVLSPTWFHLDENGTVGGNADQKYVDWAHSQGRQVWAVFSSDCQIDLAHIFLSDTKARMTALQQLLDYVEKYELDGINIDFEYMYMEDKEAYVQFIRELTPLMHEKGKTVAVCVIFHSSNERWSRCYDHEKLAEIADYLIVMAYDQHTVMAGSVASMPWVEQGIIRMLEDVPSDKLILGIPFYTRLWKESTGEDGKDNTSRETFTMKQVEKWIQENGLQIQEDELAGQHYVELKQGSITYRMWLEDFYSLEKRVELIKKYRLAGLAAWRRGIETEDVWPALTDLTNKRW